MAVTKENRETKLTLVVQTGTQVDPAYKNRIFNYINPVTTDVLLHTFGTSLGGLQSHVVDKIKRTDICELVSDE